MPRVGMAPGRVMSSRGIDAVFGAVGAGFSRACLICCLSWLKRMPRVFFGFGGGGFEPGFADELEAPLFAA